MRMDDEYTEIIGICHPQGDEESHDLFVRVSRLETKVGRQAEFITKLEASRAGLKKENKALRLKWAGWETANTPEKFLNKTQRHFPSGKTIADAIYERPLEFLTVLPLALIHGDLQMRLWRFVYGTR